ncbi:MAG: PEP-CTERM sorting domain-containing protein [Verrucomicrobiota bacterium]
MRTRTNRNLNRNLGKFCILPCLLLTLAAFSTTNANAAVIVAEYSESSAVSGRNDIFAGEFLEIDAGADANPVWSFYTAETGGSRYVRFRFDVRTTIGDQFDFDTGGGAGFDTYNTLGTNSNPANPILTLGTDGWANTLAGSTTIDFRNNGTGAPINGLAGGGITNWVMFRPDNASTAAPDLGSGERAVAFGFTWDDVNTSSTIDAGDKFGGLYLVTADTFAEMDTVGELNAAVAAIPEPSTFALICTGIFGLAFLRRRK